MRGRHLARDYRIESERHCYHLRVRTPSREWLDEASYRWIENLRIADFEAARETLGDRIRETPLWRWNCPALEAELGAETEVWLKLELFQATGTFKARGALLNLLAAPDLAAGVTAVSAGNHAIAVAYAARALGTSAKVVMTESANPVRVERCRRLEAEVCLVPDVHRAFELVRRIEVDEGRLFVHPFEGRNTLLGTGSLGWEIGAQLEAPDWLIVPIGGGGLIAGVAAAVKLRFPNCKVIGVEPRGADSMTRSLAAGSPQAIERVATIADSLGAPHAAPMSFRMCQKFVDEVVLIDDQEMRRAMLLLFNDAKLAVEPAGAAATAALMGPLSDRVSGDRVISLVCGANIDAASFSRHLRAASKR